MADLLREVKPAKKVQSNIEKFESLTLNENKQRSRSNSRARTKPIIEVEPEIEPVPLLTAVSSKLIEKPVDQIADTRYALAPAKPAAPTHKRHDSTVFIQKDYLKDNAPPSLFDDARDILKCQPGLEDIEAVVVYIQYGIDRQHDFNIKLTGPKSSQLVRVLVTTTIPDLWPNLSRSKLDGSAKRMRETLLQALFSVTGLEALLEQIRFHTRSSVDNNPEVLGTYVDFLSNLLEGSEIVLRFLSDTMTLYDKEVQRRLFWQSILSLLAGSKVLSSTGSIPNTVAETGSSLNVRDWLLNGEDYSKWLARNIVKASIELNPKETRVWSNLSQLLKRGLSLGYRDVFVSKVYTSLLLGSVVLWSPLHRLIQGLPSHDQKVLFDCILNDLSRTYFKNSQHLPPSTTDPTTARAIAGSAALIHGLTSHNEYLLECAVDWVSASSGPDCRGCGIRRALLAVLAQSQGNLERILESTLTVFSNKRQIQHAATTQQEHIAQTILLVIGYMHRQSPPSLKQDPIPSLIMNTVSNRLSSSVPRIRILGMIVGVGLSECVDEPGKVMNFDVEEMETEEVKELLALTTVKDSIGDVQDLKTTGAPFEEQTPSRKRKIVAPRSPKSKKPKPTSKVITIEEVSSSSDSEDDLVPYAKPVDDPEDSDEDPTLIKRDKPRPPIYIIDLIKQLQSSSDKLDVISLALKTATGLIKRKAGFGTELSDNIHSLASALINLQDGMSEPEHQQQRLDALIACLVARPEQMGKYLSNTYFDGDFSLAQRSTLLIAIGMGARQLAGFTDTTTAPGEPLDLFPSQRLPTHLQPKPISNQQNPPTSTSRKQNQKQKQKHHPPTNPISALANNATLSTIRPLALAAASTTTESGRAPDILKIAHTTRTSSSLSQTRTKQQQQQATQPQRTKPIPRNIHAILANNIYIPLTIPLTALLSYTTTATRQTSTSTSTLLLHPTVLILHLQTLTLTLHTLGPPGLSPPQIFTTITHETLSLLTALAHHPNRSRTIHDPTVLPAALSLLLALLDITVEIGVSAQERLLGADLGDQVAELVRWVGALEGMRGGGGSGSVPAPTTATENGGVAWTVLAAGVQVRWYEMGRRFQGRMLGLEVDD
ncbi:telomere binding protein [Exophiala xenobiotica]|uniref:Telomere binding protein n=1 Tax=Lithohypha guttulata TaxID=1690604 RepID=A0ABR0K8J0_9EURO|nr:telomere binding protein [Lithohypha guttulata]KAK5312913.1 telomere binding protein [Exophiala xenobiotica]